MTNGITHTSSMTLLGMEPAAAHYVLSDRSLVMTLKQLKLFATATPIAAVLSIEITRYFIIGGIPLWHRLVLDGVAVAAISSSQQ